LIQLQEREIEHTVYPEDDYIKRLSDFEGIFTVDKARRSHK
jgi:hypothetical protein